MKVHICNSLFETLSLSLSQVSSVILAVSNLSSPSTLSAESLSELSYFLPQLGTDFLSKLSQSQLDSALPSLASVPFSPAQVPSHVGLHTHTHLNSYEHR